MTGSLPNAGGIMDQDYKTMKALMAIESMINHIESERVKKK